MSKVTLVNIRISDTVFMPLGLLYLASVLEKERFIVQLIDLFSYESEREIIRKIKEFEPKYIGFSIVTPAYQKTKEFKQKLMAILPDRIYFAGGIHPTVLPEKTITELDLDFVVRGEGEYVLLETLRNLENKCGFDEVEGISLNELLHTIAWLIRKI